MKNFFSITLVFIFFTFASCGKACAEESVVLELSEINTYKVPAIKSEAFMPTDQDGKIVTDNRDYSLQVNDEEPVFESKAGQAFEKFINNKTVNKKVNIFSTQIKTQPYNEMQ